MFFFMILMWEINSNVFKVYILWYLELFKNVLEFFKFFVSGDILESGNNKVGIL